MAPPSRRRGSTQTWVPNATTRGLRALPGLPTIRCFYDGGANTYEYIIVYITPKGTYKYRKGNRKGKAKGKKASKKGAQGVKRKKNRFRKNQHTGGGTAVVPHHQSAGSARCTPERDGSGNPKKTNHKVVPVLQRKQRKTVHAMDQVRHTLHVSDVADSHQDCILDHNEASTPQQPSGLAHRAHPACTGSEYEHTKKMKIHSSCEIEYFVETYLCKLCVILRSRVLRVVCSH